MSISDAKNGSWISLFRLEVARALAAQLAIAFQFILSQDFVHGDLHRGNVLLRLSREFDQLSTEKLYERYGEPIYERVNRLDGQELPSGVPRDGVLPVWLGEASEIVTLQEARILVSDFGEAFSPVQEQKFESHTPLLIRPPESRFEPTKPLTFSSDIWTLACTIWDIIAQRSLFEGFLTNEDGMTCQQIEALGRLPPEWREKWDACRDNTKHGEFKNRSTSPSQWWHDHFETSVQRPRIETGMAAIDSCERDAIFSMLRSMLSFRPEDRPSAQQVLESEWMIKWASPEYERIKVAHK
ncbi:protein kinase domain protein [Penicillium cataractarum]|uniref:Protein kinase domain protein n=1 Tax=Penicillium cataractarum TaxID=2100454 RepID=A0A9W9VTQ8_9EURO|nr:protein kinase domain protein [Penicillium cataractarum]KAJ5389186.1 protein kinase domain protein [Penicillium cataractarum]